VRVSVDSAMKMSAMWACLRLRADLVSTMPLEVIRTVGGIDVQAASTPFLDDPEGQRLRRRGLAVLVADRARPHRQQRRHHPRDRRLRAAGDRRARPDVAGPDPRQGPDDHEVAHRQQGLRARDIWHERQFTLPGIPLGISPVAQAMLTLGGYLSAQQFGLDWFANGRIPAGKLKNTEKTVSSRAAKVIKDRFKAAVENRDLFVHGKDWEYDLISVQDGESQFIEAQRFGIADVARFMGTPGDLIDADTGSTAKITYANITQRHLQYLLIHLGRASSGASVDCPARCRSRGSSSSTPTRCCAWTRRPSRPCTRRGSTAAT
jgi:hypothetical protein